jgi:hypothetical protein
MATARQRQKPQPQQSNRRVLRIGVILGGKIVEEKLVRDRVDVTVGQSAKNTFAVPVEGLPRSWPLFVVQNDRYFLNFLDTMDGRMSEGGEVKTFAAMKGRTAKQRGNAWVVPLVDTARGKIVLGDMTLLFQFVTEPPRQPRPHLPPSVRGTLADRIDPMLAIILAISILLHFTVGLIAYRHDRVVKTRAARIYNETFQRSTVAATELEPMPELDDKPTEPDQADKEAEKPAKQSSSDDKPRKASDDDSDKDQGGRSPEEALRLQEEARELALDLMTGGFSDTALDRGGGDRDPKHDLNEVIDDINRTGASVSDIGGSSGRGTRDDGDDRIGTSKGPQVEGPGDSTVKTGPKTKEKVPSSRVKLGGGSSDDSTTLRPEDVMRKIQSVYMSGLKRCHKDLLKRDPSAGGRVALKFMVGPSGRITRVKADGFDPSVDKCIEARAKAWRFGVPKDDDGEPTDATFRVALQLVAD